MINFNKGEILWNKANSIIPGGNMLLSKNKNLFSPDFWPNYYSRAKDAYVWDLDGNKFLDFSSNGVGACSLGHANKKIDKEVLQAINNGVMSTLNSPNEVHLAEYLVSIHPWASMAKFARSGGEANAVAIRIARCFTGREKIAICGYHGWHDWYLAANLSSKDNLKDHLLEGLGSKGVPKTLADSIVPLRYNNFDDLEFLKNSDDLAAVKMEVVRSKIPTNGYLELIKDICNEKGILLIFDECTSGFREYFGGIHLKYNIEPDMCMLGKALGNGYAISAVLGKKDIMLSACDTFISSTFWTEAVGPTAALATLKEMSNVKSWEILPKIGLQIKNIWSKYSKKYNLPITINGIDALPTFIFNCYESNGFKTVFTQFMLEEGFLATNLFYPTTKHKDVHIRKYDKACDKTFKKLSTIFDSKSSPSTLCKGNYCKSSFKRLN